MFVLVDCLLLVALACPLGGWATLHACGCSLRHGGHRAQWPAILAGGREWGFSRVTPRLLKNHRGLGSSEPFR